MRWNFVAISSMQVEIYTLLHILFRLLTSIFNISHFRMSDFIRTGPTVLLDFNNGEGGDILIKSRNPVLSGLTAAILKFGGRDYKVYQHECAWASPLIGENCMQIFNPFLVYICIPLFT